MATEKTARAIWEGDLMSGSGRVSTGSGVLSVDGITWSARAEDAEGVSPEELIAAAHATCVSMALSHALAEHGHAPTRLETKATIDLRQDGGRLPADDDEAAIMARSRESTGWNSSKRPRAPRKTARSRRR